jgi:hypothetical protein
MDCPGIGKMTRRLYVKKTKRRTQQRAGENKIFLPGTAAQE